MKSPKNFSWSATIIHRQNVAGAIRFQAQCRSGGGGTGQAGGGGKCSKCGSGGNK